jgi:glycosyltransferase involved in cell wall biosynthesis
MRIAIVINTTWNIYNFRMGLIRAFLRENFEVYAVAPADEYVERIEDAGCHHCPVQLDNKGTNPLNDIDYLLSLYRIYREIRPDVVLHFTIKPNLYGTAAARLLGIPAINNVSGLGTVFLRENLTSKIARQLYRFCFRFPAKIFFQNGDDRNYFIQKKLVNRSLTDVLPGSGVDLAHFLPTPFKRNPTFTFLLAARLLYDKGILEYIEAIRILQAKGLQAIFQLVGFRDDSPFGVTDEQLSEWTSSGLVTYLGATDNIREVMQRADCVVLPSYREGTPRALLEAAALAKPLIATRVPGCVEVVEDGVNGLLCEVKSAASLAAKMEKMINLNQEALMQMGAASRYKVESKFDEGIVIGKYLDAVYAALGQAEVPAGVVVA